MWSNTWCWLPVLLRIRLFQASSSPVQDDGDDEDDHEHARHAAEDGPPHGWRDSSRREWRLCAWIRNWLPTKTKRGEIRLVNVGLEAFLWLGKGSHYKRNTTCSCTLRYYCMVFFYESWMWERSNILTPLEGFITTTWLCTSGINFELLSNTR